MLRLYHETIVSVLGGATLLNFNRSGWQPQDGVHFARALTFCTEVETIQMARNFVGDEGCAAIAEAVSKVISDAKLTGKEESGDAKGGDAPSWSGSQWIASIRSKVTLADSPSGEQAGSAV